jgi:hypothetical protein
MQMFFEFLIDRIASYSWLKRTVGTLLEDAGLCSAEKF